jgi:hypothetical protein
MSYIPGLQGAGSNFGTIAVMNSSAEACVWRGGVSLTPLTADQQIMSNAVTQSATVSGLLLSPHGHVFASGNERATDRIAEIIIRGEARDDGSSANGLCTTAHEVTPAYWGVATADAKFTVRNYGQNPNGFTGLTWCRGNGFGVSVDGRP